MEGLGRSFSDGDSWKEKPSVSAANCKCNTNNKGLYQRVKEQRKRLTESYPMLSDYGLAVRRFLI